MSKFTTNRRTLAKAGLWSAPLIAATAAVPVYAASSPSVIEPVIRFGVFAQAAAENPTQLVTRLGTSSEFGGTASPDGTSTDGTGSQSVGAGSFTPGGSLGGFNSGVYGGVGLWFSSPEESTGNKLVGSATLAPGAVIAVTYAVTFDEDYLVYTPDSYLAGTSTNLVAQTSGAAVEATGVNSAAMTASHGAENVAGTVWSATSTFTTTEAAEAVTGANEYAQLLFSQAPAHYLENPEATFSVTVTVLSGSLVGLLETGHTFTQDLAGQTATAVLPAILLS